MQTYEHALRLWQKINDGEIKISDDTAGDDISELIHRAIESAAIQYGGKHQLIENADDAGEAVQNTMADYVRVYEWLD